MSAVADTLSRTSFPALGVTVELALVAPDDEAEPAFGATRALVEELERILTRFDPASGLCTLNARGRVSGEPVLAEVVALAAAARERTDGRFDPTVHDALCDWGYDRDFDEITNDPRPVPASRPCGGVFTVDVRTGSVRLERGTRLDLGGIAKGYVVDRAAELLGRAGSCFVNAGGDVAVRGALDGSAWPVEVETPSGPMTLGLPFGALATSGVDERRWRRGDVDAHHLIDPRTGAPSRSDLLRVTAAGATAVDAEVTAKALFLAGSVDAAQEAESNGIPCVLVTQSGETILTGGVT